MTEVQCPVCTQQGVTWEREGNRDEYRFECQTCGHFLLDGDLVPRANNTNAPRIPEDERHLLVQYIRRSSTRLQPVTLTRDLLEHPREAGGLREVSVSTKLRRMLLLLAERTRRPGNPVPLARADIYEIGAVDDTDLRQLFNHLRDRKLILVQHDTTLPWTATVSVTGMQEVESLLSARPRGNRAFVAMWFDSSLTEAWQSGIRPALIECGYEPVRVDGVQHNGKICDKIISEIRSASLLVADFTGDRGGVYFEAGFALALNIPVVWTCHADDFAQVHFDTRQYNHIVWTSADELRMMLADRIKATVVRRDD